MAREVAIIGDYFLLPETFEQIPATLRGRYIKEDGGETRGRKAAQAAK